MDDPPGEERDRDATPGDVFVHRPGDAWSAQRRLRVGTTLRIELIPAGGYRWSDVESSDPQAAEATGVVGADGVLRAEVSARRAGVVMLSATTSHTGDRFGPPTRIWRMTLEISE